MIIFNFFLLVAAAFDLPSYDNIRKSIAAASLDRKVASNLAGKLVSLQVKFSIILDFIFEKDIESGKMHIKPSFAFMGNYLK